MIYTLKFHFTNAIHQKFRNLLKIVMSLFGAAYAAPKKDTTIFYQFILN